MVAVVVTPIEGSRFELLVSVEKIRGRDQPICSLEEVQAFDRNRGVCPLEREMPPQVLGAPPLVMAAYALATGRSRWAVPSRAVHRVAAVPPMTAVLVASHPAG